MSVHVLFERVPERGGLAGGRALTLSARIVARVRDDLFERRLRPGDFLGTEKELAARHGTSRIVARDALRTLEALGIVGIRPGAGGGARITHGNPQLFAEALAVQLELSDISVAEILDTQRAIECLAAERAAERATTGDHARLRALIDEAAGQLGDLQAFTRSSLRFHLAVAKASKNRVLEYQLVSLQHVSWPSRNKTLTRPVARRILEAHRELLERIEARDSAGAREIMDGHVRMIRNRRVAEGKPKRPVLIVRKKACC
jgi:GntR family transcriptional regulator, transcriptional repressor for pyruvate dehydrogenase complex